jgi:hypothetical protein
MVGNFEGQLARRVKFSPCLVGGIIPTTDAPLAVGFRVKSPTAVGAEGVLLHDPVLGEVPSRSGIRRDEISCVAHPRRPIDLLDDVEAQRQEDGEGREAAVPLGLLAFLTPDFAYVGLELDGCCMYVCVCMSDGEQQSLEANNKQEINKEGATENCRR